MTAIKQVWERRHDGTIWLVEMYDGQVKAAVGPLPGPQYQLCEPGTIDELATPPALAIAADINAHVYDYELYRA